MDPYQKPIISTGPTPPQERPPSHPEDQEDKSKEKAGAIAFILNLIKTTLNLFKLQKNAPTQNLSFTPLLEFKKSLEIMKNEDRSEDTHFLTNLAKIWKEVLEVPSHEKIANLLKKINTYPESEIHTFGYYLSENRDLRWIPFPYMELIQKIHKEHEKNPKMSSLTEWTNLIDEILSS